MCNLLFILFFTCSTNLFGQPADLVGKEVSTYFDYENGNYTEMFFDKNGRFYTCNEQGLLSHIEYDYCIKGDSLFLGYTEKEEMIFSGIINLSKEGNFSLSVRNKKYILLETNSSLNIENYVRGNISEYEYIDGYYERRHKFVEQLCLDKIDYYQFSKEERELNCN